MHQPAQFQTIPSTHPPGSAQKPQIWSVSLSQNSDKIRKINNCDHSLTCSAGAQDTSACKISGLLPSCVLQEMPGSLSGLTDGQMDRWIAGRIGWKMVTVDRMDQRTHVRVERGYLGFRMEEWTDGQPENIMPPVPKGGGIKIKAPHHWSFVRWLMVPLIKGQ